MRLENPSSESIPYPEVIGEYYTGSADIRSAYADTANGHLYVVHRYGIRTLSYNLDGEFTTLSTVSIDDVAGVTNGSSDVTPGQFYSAVKVGNNLYVSTDNTIFFL